MPAPPPNWQILPPIQPPTWFVEAVKHHAPEISGQYAAALLWSRGIQDPEQLLGFLNPKLYQPASPLEFGQEMNWAVDRIVKARRQGERIAIWGDFDADGITSTSVLWDGLREFFPESDRLVYYIPNRLTESHGLNIPGIETLAQTEIRLIITCDTGSTNVEEIEYANHLGIDVIVTDHHTLPEDRPPVVAIINPRYLSTSHPLFHLSGVAVAYKLIEALYQTLPGIPQRPLEALLDLVAIGLIADLVQLTGDCRYLAQLGIERLQQQLSNPTRPGVAKLLELCKRNGDRPTDISFGLGPRINAVSRIQGDATFCVELLTSRDPQRCHQLALLTELANARRKSLQKDVTKDVAEKLAQLDLSTTSVIVLADSQWPLGVLGLVAGQVAQEYGRPTILLSIEESEDVKADAANDTTLSNSPQKTHKIARGSARSVDRIDLYQLVKSQSHLLSRFGGHPFAAGLSLPVENIPLFTEAINWQLRQQSEIHLSVGPVVQADLTVTVSELGKDLFQELKLLEPCGMGNPVPKLFVQNCWFENTWNQKIQDVRGQKLDYIKTDFEIWDETVERGFPGIWWGHYQDEIPLGRCNIIAELDFNTFKKRYEIRLLAIQSNSEKTHLGTPSTIDWILDWRRGTHKPARHDEALGQANETFAVQDLADPSSLIQVTECPTSWEEVQAWCRRALYSQEKLALAYSLPVCGSPAQVWQQLVGIAKYLSRTDRPVTRQQLRHKLGLGDTSLQLGFKSLSLLGFQVTYRDRAFYMTWQPQALDRKRKKSRSAKPFGTHSPTSPSKIEQSISTFLVAVSEEQFRQKYFCEVPLATIQAMARATVVNDCDSDLTAF